jgi:hypothetical protein
LLRRPSASRVERPSNYIRSTGSRADEHRSFSWAESGFPVADRGWSGESSAAGYEIDAMFERRDKLVAHIQALIDEHGEGAVLFHSER